MDVDLKRIPDPGFTLNVKGHRFTLINWDEYDNRKSGERRHILHWRGTCAACGADFFTDSGLRSSWIRRRCLAHQKTSKVLEPWINPFD